MHLSYRLVEFFYYRLGGFRFQIPGYKGEIFPFIVVYFEKNTKSKIDSLHPDSKIFKRINKRQLLFLMLPFITCLCYFQMLILKECFLVQHF